MHHRLFLIFRLFLSDDAVSQLQHSLIKNDPVCDHMYFFAPAFSKFWLPAKTVVEPEIVIQCSIDDDLWGRYNPAS